MFSRLNPLDWGWVKATFVVLAIVVSIGITYRKQRWIHMLVELAGLLCLIMLFAHGVMTRGVLGTSVSHPHEWYYYAILIPHVLCGGLYIALAVALVFAGLALMIKKQNWISKRALFKFHKRYGYRAQYALVVSVILALPL